MYFDKKLKSFNKAGLAKYLGQMGIHQIDVDKILEDYMATLGFKAEARKLEDDLEPRGPLKILIFELLIHGRTEEALEMVLKFYPELEANDKFAFFQLKKLVLLELIRFGNVERAKMFIQTEFIDIVTMPEAHSELVDVWILLLTPNPSASPFAKLLELPHRIKITVDIHKSLIELEDDGIAKPKVEFLKSLIAWVADEFDAEDDGY